MGKKPYKSHKDLLIQNTEELFQASKYRVKFQMGKGSEQTYFQKYTNGQ